METWITSLITIVCSVVASSGFWAYLQKREDKKDAKTKMILGLGHDRLLYLCIKYIERGSITHDELENLHEYLYNPYLELGGNGTITLLMKKIDLLPVTKNIQKGEEEIK